MAKMNLLKFSASNCYSFKDKYEVYFTADTNGYSDFFNRDLIKTNDEQINILPVSVFYGANASGKTNILNSISLIYSLLNRKDRDQSELPECYFKSNPDHTVSLEYSFIINDIVYEYSLSFNSDKIISENLSYNNDVNIYSRRNVNEYKSYSNEISSEANKEVEDLLKGRTDILVLEILAKRGVEGIKIIYDFFKTFRLLSPYYNYANILYDDKKLRDKVLNFVKFADFGISDIIVERLDIHKTKEDASLIDDKSSLNDFICYLNFEHFNNKDFKLLSFSESLGTLSYIRFLVKFIPAFINGGIIFDDEIETSIHPLLLRNVISWFHNKNINKAGAQLIFTTHNTSILNDETLRRDEINIVEKRFDNGYSSVYPLSDFDIPDIINIEKLYLNGKLGGIPNLPSIEEIENLMKDYND